jgi:hypothetical protein
MENKDAPSSNSPIPAEEAEAELEALDLPPNLAGWIDRLPEDLLAAIDIIEKEGGGGCWLVWKKKCEKILHACLSASVLGYESCNNVHISFRPTHNK